MKKLTAILLLAVFLFNLFGYRIVFYFAQRTADLQLEAAIDSRDYQEEDLVIITVDISLPYQQDSKDFERIDGEITIEGKLYKFVKRKIADKKLVLACLPDKQKMKLRSAQKDFLNDTNAVGSERPSKGPHSKNSLVKNLLTDYDQFQVDYSTSLGMQIPDNCFARFLNKWSVVPGSSPEHPPQEA